MLLAIDIGNTNVVWGLYEGATLKGHWRLATDGTQTADEYGLEFRGLLHLAGYGPNDVHGVIISSVVPSLNHTFDTLSETYFHHTPLTVGADTDTGLTLRYANPREIGSDRIVNAAAAFHEFRTDLIIIDFGTATTFCAVTKQGDYLGGVIAPGLGISADVLWSRTAKLPKVALVKPKTVIGRDTASSMQSGLIFGYAGLVDSLVDRMSRELCTEPKVIATGGLAGIIAPETMRIHEIRPLLTLDGLALLYRRSCGEHA
ncbi:MAG: type III pantothenate kinase [Nitrospiraceae bacterium]